MAEYIVRETGYPGTIKQEIVGELERCAECIVLTRGTADKSDDEIAHAEYVWRK